MSIYQIYKDKDKDQEGQCWKWKLLDDGNEPIAYGGELFLKKNIVDSIKNIRDKSPESKIWKDESLEDKDKGYRFEYRQDNKWEWDFRAGNNKSIANGNSYQSEDEIKDALEHIKKEMGIAEHKWEDPKDDPNYKEKNDDRTETKGIPGS